MRANMLWIILPIDRLGSASGRELAQRTVVMMFLASLTFVTHSHYYSLTTNDVAHRERAPVSLSFVLREGCWVPEAPTSQHPDVGVYSAGG